MNEENQKLLAQFEFQLPPGYDAEKTRMCVYQRKLLIIHPMQRPLIYNPDTKILSVLL